LRGQVDRRFIIPHLYSYAIVTLGRSRSLRTEHAIKNFRSSIFCNYVDYRQTPEATRIRNAFAARLISQRVRVPVSGHFALSESRVKRIAREREGNGMTRLNRDRVIFSLFPGDAVRFSIFRAFHIHREQRPFLLKIIPTANLDLAEGADSNLIYRLRRCAMNPCRFKGRSSLPRISFAAMIIYDDLTAIERQIIPFYVKPAEII